jgi:hypothetical protein
MTDLRRENLWMLGSRAIRAGVAVLLVAVAGCSSKSAGSSSDDESQSENDAGGDDVGSLDATTDGAQAQGDSSLGGHDANGGDAAHSSTDATAGDAAHSPAAAAADASHPDASGSADAGVDAAHASTDAAVNDAASTDGAVAAGDSSVPAVDAGDSPADQTGATAAYCAAVCESEAVCLGDPPDASCTCDPRELDLYRSDLVLGLAACESSATCAELESDAGSPDAGLQACANAAQTNITPTAAVTAFCEQVGDSTCDADAITDCPDTIKIYSDVTVAALASCVADPTCGDHTACLTAALTPPQ